MQTVFGFFFKEWLIFVLATLLGARFIYQSATGTVPRDVTGEYRYAGPICFLVLGVLLQVPLLLRIMLV
jgi:hypothetical protein